MDWLLTAINVANLFLSSLAVYLLLKRFSQIKNLPENSWKYLPLIGAFTNFLIAIAFFRVVFTGAPTMIEMSAKVTGILLYIVFSAIMGLRRRGNDS